jgi:hypothetical protein
MAAATLFAAWILLHLPITDLVERLLHRVGLANYDLLCNAAAAAMGLAAGGAIAVREGWKLTPVTRTLLLLVVLVAVARAFLLVAPIEYIHLPQYASLGALLLRAGVPFELAWMLATGLGALDEGFQFQFLRRGRPEYFDWNDVVLNGLGAAFGLTLAAAGRVVGVRTTLAAVSVAVVATIATLVALATDPIQGPPWLTLTPRGDWFRVLSAAEGVVLLALVWTTVRGLASAPVTSDRSGVEGSSRGTHQPGPDRNL